MKIVWLPVADQSLQDQLDYIEQHNPRAALDRLRAVRQTLRRLVEFPQIGKTGRTAGTREIVVPHTPYILVYRLEADSLVVIRFVHGAQNWRDEET